MRIILITLLLFPLAAAADVYRCETAEGQVTYSSVPCSATAETVDLAPVLMSTKPVDPALLPEPEQEPDGSNDTTAAQNEQAEQPAESASFCERRGLPDGNTLRTAYAHNRVLLCMTPEQVRKAGGRHGEEYDVEKTVYRGHTITIWRFEERYENFPWTVRFENGYVVGFQDL